MSPSDRSGAGPEEGTRAGQARLTGVAQRAAQLGADLRRLLERIRRLARTPRIADAEDEETVHRVSVALERAADAAETTAATAATALREMKLPWGGQDGVADPPPAAAPDAGPVEEEAEFPLLELLIVARRAVRIEADVSDLLWRLRLLQLSPDGEISQGAGWTLERLTAAGEAARQAACLIEEIVEGAGRGE